MLKYPNLQFKWSKNVKSTHLKISQLFEELKFKVESSIKT